MSVCRLSQTEFQHVAGTRAPHEWVEVTENCSLTCTSLSGTVSVDGVLCYGSSRAKVTDTRFEVDWIMIVVPDCGRDITAPASR